MGKRMFIDYLEILGEQYTIRIHGRVWGNGKYILFMSFDPEIIGMDIESRTC